MAKLTVHELPTEDCWRDMARIPQKFRKTGTGQHVDKHAICKVTIGIKTKLLALRGCRDLDDPRIHLDATTRTDLDVKVGQSYEVTIHPVRWFGYWKWAWGAADPAYRLTAQISLLSLVLGVIGLLLGALSVWPIFSQWASHH
ncbi:MAG TPA: hypothetical protein VN950_04960 [Terriglobales bacterium]|nr:hypothetical protein [Terriglobales bacterium]